MFDKVLKAKKIYTLNHNCKTVEWVAINGNKICQIGSGKSPEARETIDMGYYTIIPGLMDAHVHGTFTALLSKGVNVFNASTVSETCELIKDYCLKSDEDIIIAHGYLKDIIKEGRFPTKDELDVVSNGKSVIIISISGHASVFNSKALEGIDIPSNYCGALRSNGELTGEMIDDDAHFFAFDSFADRITDDEKGKYIDSFANMCIECGITSVHCLENFGKKHSDIGIWNEKINDGNLPVHAVLYPQSWDYESVQQYGIPRHGGCLTLDGSEIEYTIALNEPYANNNATRGFLFRNDDLVYQLVSKAHRDGKQCAFHAMGDRAIDQILWIYHRVIKEQGQKNLRHRIEHFSLPTDQHIRMAAELGVIVNPQPEYPYLFENELENYYGKERAKRFENYRSWTDAGLIVTGSSDAPVNTLSPLSGIHALVNTSNKSRKFTVTEALEMYTKNVAYAAFEENERGTIKEGYYADFTVLSDDPYEIPDKIKDIEVMATIVEGNVVYQK